MLSVELNAYSHYTIKKSIDRQPILSIIIPTYNRSTTIAQCLSQLRAMSYDQNDIELILIDDSSTDNTYDVLQDFIADFSNIITLRRKVNSASASLPRNNGLKIASGKWILFIDSDDYITPHTLTDALAVTKIDTATDMICMPYFKAENSSRATMDSAFTYAETVTGLSFIQTKLYNSLNAVGKLFRASLISEHNIDFPIHIQVREDNWFMMKLYSVTRRIAILGNSKKYYFINEIDKFSLSGKGTSPAAAVQIFLSVYDFIKTNSGLSLEEQHNFLAIYLNRYTNMIKRGKNAPLRFFEHTKETLLALLETPYTTENAKNFIHDLYAGKYDINRQL